MPPGNKGKTKLKKPYWKVAPNKAYHSGERASTWRIADFARKSALSAISASSLAEIRASAPVPLGEIDRAVVSG